MLIYYNNRLRLLLKQFF